MPYTRICKINKMHLQNVAFEVGILGNTEALSSKIEDGELVIDTKRLIEIYEKENKIENKEFSVNQPHVIDTKENNCIRLPSLHETHGHEKCQSTNQPDETFKNQSQYIELERRITKIYSEKIIILNILIMT